MGKIHVLDKHVAELIAAGEVVERPSSVIKEVVENAIDAGATSITVEIQHGGTTFMRVTDNGCGIAREDVPKAFIRHATSKVYQQDDLDHIGTLGFRGEALASICAVSKVTLLTRTQEELAGTHYQIDGGESESGCEDAGCPVGTTLVIRDLFYNTPARMKFLKKDVSEANAVAGVVDRIALSHPEISIRFIRDGKNQLQTPGDGQLKSCIYAVYGKEFTGGLIPVDYQLDGVKVTGFVSKPSASRPTRSMQHFFINGRYVKSRTAMAALEEAFKGSIMVGKFPSCVLHLEISCEAVDVNVHPAKIEVRFINERPIFEAVYHGVKSALLAGDSRSELSFSKKVPSYAVDKKTAEPPQRVQEKYVVPKPAQISIPPSPEKREKVVLLEETTLAEEKQNHQEEEPEVSIPPKTVFSAVRVSDIGQSIPYEDAMKHRQIGPEEEKNARPVESSPQQEIQKKQNTKKKEESTPEILAMLPGMEQIAFEKEEKKTRLIGEAFQTYILVEYGKDQLLLIDKHAAHERILYEKLKRESGKSCAQMLLEAVPVTLEKEEYSALLEHQKLLDEAGFEVDDFGAGTVLVRSAPLSLDGTDIASAMIEIAGYLRLQKSDLHTEHLDWLYHNIACRAAVKAGNHSEPQELIDLARKLEENPEIRYCPHGRPVSIAIRKKEIEKQFGRV